MQGASDITAVINVGGVLTHWTGVQDEGGALTRYDFSPVGGPPSADYDTDVREPLAFNITTKVLGVDQAARETFVTRFVEGTTFDNVATPAGASQMHVSERPSAIGRRFTVTNRTADRKMGQPTEMTIRLEESGAVA